MLLDTTDDHTGVHNITGHYHDHTGVHNVTGHY